MHTPWEDRYAQRTANMQDSAIRELLKLTQQPEIISFAGGLPAPEVFPLENFRIACEKVLIKKGTTALQYGTTEGYTPLLEIIARHSARYGIQVTTDNIMITSGSQQALDLLGKIFINRGDSILVEAPTYLGALQAWAAYGARYLTIDMDENGMLTDQLEEKLRSGIKFIYVLPNFQNPSGVTLSLERREQLVRISNQYGVPIIEDDPYGQLRFEGTHLPTIEVVDCRMNITTGDSYTGNVIYLSTFSKILAPGLRLAWVIAPPEVIHKLVQAKQGSDLQTATFNQMVAHEIGQGGFFDRHVKKICEVYKYRRDVMLESLESTMPEGVRWTKPQGGLFLWLSLPDNIQSKTIFLDAVKDNVAFVPGEPFYPYSGGESSMRLNFSNSSPEKIEEGISRLSKVIKQHM